MIHQPNSTPSKRPARHPLLLGGALLALLVLTSCASTSRFSPAAVEPPSHGDTAEGTAPSNIDPAWFTGVASWYGDRYHGRTTASGEPYDMHEFTAAHRNLPFGTIVRVTRTDTRQQVVVRINDRGPFIDGRVIDLSRAAAEDVEMIRRGTAPVEIDVIQWGTGRRVSAASR